MAWRRLGLVFVPDGSLPWAHSHAALPAPLHLAGDVFRFFYSSRDAQKRSHVGWVDVEVSEAPRVLGVAREPVLTPGEDGAFDDSGVGIGCVVELEDGLSIYYMGWNLGVRSPWRNAIGLARSQAPATAFERLSPGPILDRSPADPYTLSYPCVLRLGPEDWRMWYGSNLAPAVGNADMQHAIKLARSVDGIHWTRDGKTVVGFAADSEYALARPSVTKVGDRLLMCFACRGQHYRIGAASSDDGVAWDRLDAVIGLQPSGTGWESETTCYPALFWHRGSLWLAYNGDGYGATGFGLARWEGELPV
jgi:beta-1,4-mannooligosaccharide phosphorylase